MFNPVDLTMKATQPLSDADMAVVPHDWLVVFFQRAGSRAVKQERELMEILYDAFGLLRVKFVMELQPILESEYGQ